MSLLQHVQASGHKLCGCGGYHYKHRPGSPFCERNHRAAYNHLLRAGETDQEVLIECLVDSAWSGVGFPLKQWPFLAQKL